MESIAVFALVGWIPVSVAFFAAMPPRRAVVSAAVIGWLFLPVTRVGLPGLPDLTKASAPMAGLLLGVLVYDPGRLAALRPRWADLPILSWCAAPFFSSLSNDLGPYDGFSGTLNHAINWGLPYLIGRTYLGDARGQRELAVGVVAGGLAYVPLCLFEIRFSPQLHRIVYGFSPSAFGQTIRFGGYRPQVFMIHGLELGMWMTAATLAGWHLGASGAPDRLWRLPLKRVVLPVLLVTTVLCKSTGSMFLLATGVATLWSARRRARFVFVWVVALVAPVYCSSRIAGLWNGREAVDFFNTVLGPERAQSLEFRVSNEDLLIAKAMQRPAFGWGGWGRARVYNEEGRDLTVTDGLWVIALGNHGLFGLASVTALTLSPFVRLALKRPAASWGSPEFAPAAAVAVLLGLLTIDDLGNAMFNPIFLLGAGGLSALPCYRPGDDDPAPGPSAAAVEALHRGIEADRRADADRGGASAGESGSLEESEAAWRSAVSLLDREARRRPGDRDLHRALATGHEAHARSLIRLGLTGEALRARERALGLRAALAAESPSDPEALRDWADGLNDLAWLLAVRAEPGAGPDAARAVDLARDAVRLFPEHPPYWNTLGAALLRTRAWLLAVKAVDRSVVLHGGGGTCFDHLLLALAHLGRGDADRARPWFERGVEWLDRQPVAHPGLNALRREAHFYLSRAGGSGGDHTPGADPRSRESPRGASSFLGRRPSPVFEPRPGLPPQPTEAS